MAAPTSSAITACALDDAGANIIQLAQLAWTKTLDRDQVAELDAACSLIARADAGKPPPGASRGRWRAAVESAKRIVGCFEKQTRGEVVAFALPPFAWYGLTPGLLAALEQCATEERASAPKQTDGATKESVSPDPYSDWLPKAIWKGVFDCEDTKAVEMLNKFKITGDAEGGRGSGRKDYRVKVSKLTPEQLSRLTVLVETHNSKALLRVKPRRRKHSAKTSGNR